MMTIQKLTNAGSKALNVNGATTPKTFSYTASGDQLLNSIICVLKDGGTTSFLNFGAIASLTNGVLIQITKGGITTTLATINDNADMCMVFPSNQFGNGAILSILSIATPEGFGDTNNCFMGLLQFSHPVTLADGDSVSVVIRDDLHTVDVFQMSCGVYL